MCGITGFFLGQTLGSRFSHASDLRNMNETLWHRGPDDSGCWFDEHYGIGLAHRRLSIIDVSRAGQQPMLSSSGRFRIVFNGEVYNHIEIRKEIESSKNIDWKSTSDTETLLEAFEMWGVKDSVTRFVGMFALALWDQQEQALYLIRDRIGEKPLYYGWQNNVFMFGSELKALAAHPCFENKLDKRSVALFMRYSYVPDPYSIFEGIHKVPPSSIIKIPVTLKCRELPEASAYWSLKDAFLDGKNDLILDPKEAVAGLKNKLQEAIRIQSRSDVPLGAFLSGGIDSSLVVSLLQEHSSKPINTYTIGFENQEYDEAGTASRIAKILGTDHTEHYVTVSEALDVIPKLATLYDEPFADSSQIPTYIVSKLAATEVNVALSGDGGDELFGGYNRYISAPRIHRAFDFIPHVIRSSVAKSFDSLPIHIWQVIGRIFRVNQAPDKVKKVLSILQSKDLDVVYARLTSHWFEENELVLNVNSDYSLNNDWMGEGSAFEPEDKMMYQDMTNYLLGDILVKLDRASMGVSLESRVPFLDFRVIEYACRLPLDMKIRDSKGKWPLRRILEDYLPKEIFDSPKMGFGVPLHEWLRGPLRDWGESLLNETRLRDEGVFNVGMVRKKWLDHLTGKGNYQHELWNVLMFQSWHENFLNRGASKKLSNSFYRN